MFELGDLRSLVHGEPSRAQFLVIISALLAVQDEHDFEFMLRYAAPILRARWPCELRLLEISASDANVARILERLMIFELVYALRMETSPELCWVLEAFLSSPHLAHLRSLAILGGVGDAQLLLLAQTPHLRSLKQLEISAEDLNRGISADNLDHYNFSADSLKALFNSPALPALQAFKLEIESSPASLEAIFIHQPQWPHLDVFELRLWGKVEASGLEVLSRISTSPVTSLSLACTNVTALLSISALSSLRELTLYCFELEHAHLLAQGAYPHLRSLTLKHLEPINLAPLSAPSALPALKSLSVNVGYDEDDGEPTPCDCAGFERVTALRCWGRLPAWFWERVPMASIQRLCLAGCVDLVPVCDALRCALPTKLRELLITDCVLEVAQLDPLMCLTLPALERLQLSELCFKGEFKHPIRAPQWPKLERIELLEVSQADEQWRPLIHSPWMQHVSCMNIRPAYPAEWWTVDASPLYEALISSPYLGSLEHLMLCGFMPALCVELWQDAHLPNLRSIGCDGHVAEEVISADTLLAAIHQGQLPKLAIPKRLLKVEQEPVWSPSSLNLSPFAINVQVIQALSDGAYLHGLRSLTLGYCAIDEQAWALLMSDEGLATLQFLRISPLKLTPMMCEALRQTSFLASLRELTLFLDGLDDREVLRILCAIPALRALPRVVTAPWGRGVLTGEAFVALLEQRLWRSEAKT